MIRVFEDADRLAEAAVDLFIQHARRARDARGRFDLALCGGSTPRPIYRRFAEAVGDDPRWRRHSCRQLFWSRVHLWWGDERCVPPDDERSNYRLARECLIDRVPIPADNVHRIPVVDLSPDEAARRYESLYPDEVDLLHLGLGGNAHTASLFPHDEALRETSRLFLPVEVDAEPPRRITLTPPGIARARNIVVTVVGERKAEAVARAFAPDGAIDETPARLVRDALWLLDEPAASQLDPALRRRGT